MNTYIAKCVTLGCPSAFTRVELFSGEFPTNVTCGNCGFEITSVALVEPEQLDA